MQSDEAAVRLARWTEIPHESGLFSWSDIADLELILKEREDDARLVGIVTEEARSVPSFPEDFDIALGVLYAHFYSRLQKKDEN